jgi:cadmium resistance protein CadD (predicted permease)
LIDFEKYWNIIIQAWYAINPWIFAGLALLYFALDSLYSQYVISIGRLKPLSTSNYSALLILLTGLATSEYVQNLWYLIPMCLGAWVGSFTSVDRERKKRNKRAQLKRQQKKELMKKINT